MNSLAPISITATPGSLWKWGTIVSAMFAIRLCRQRRCRWSALPSKRALAAALQIFASAVALDRHASGAKPHRIGSEAAEAGAAAAHEGPGPLDVRETLQQPADRDLRLHARERHPGTGMNAGSEG